MMVMVMTIVTMIDTVTVVDRRGGGGGVDAAWKLTWHQRATCSTLSGQRLRRPT